MACAGPARRRGDELRLPATLREVVRGRLATVPPRARELLRAAAILDDAFPVAIAARLIGRPALECLPALDAAVASGLLVLESPGGTVRFTHALVRAALHDGLPLQQRVLLHARAARAIEELYPDALDQHAAALARHYAESALAGDRAPALRWARRAGDNALRDLAFEEAARLYTVALDHTTGGPPADRGRLLLTRATAHFRAGNLEPARADCLAAGELARRTGDGHLLAERALILEPVGNHLWDREIHEWCLEALTAEASLGDGYQADETTAERGGSDPALAGGAGSLFGAVDFDARSVADCPSGRLPESLRARLLARATEAASYLGRWDEIGETSSRALALADRCLYRAGGSGRTGAAGDADDRPRSAVAAARHRAVGPALLRPGAALAR